MKPLILALMGLIMAVLPAAAQDSDYLIKVGDVLRIEVQEDASLNRSVLVAPDGRITLPLAGPVKVSGDSVDQVQALLSDKLAPNFATKPTVYVSIDSVAAPVASGGGAPRAINVFVIGQALKPGKYAVDQGTTILQFLAEIGGFTDFAAVKRIQLRRTDATGKETVYILNYKAVVDGTPNAVTGTVANGDVFVIPPRHLFE
jgi:polysaccharide export outer membrane protein